MSLLRSTSAIGSPDPAAAIEALAPTTPTYRALRQALAAAIARAPPAGDKATASRVREIEVNLERQRWLPRQLPAGARLGQPRRRAAGAVPRRSAGLLDPGRSSARIGQSDARSSSAAIDGVLFNPPWNVPHSIATEEILPKLGARPELSEPAPHGDAAQWRACSSCRDRGAALGQIKFEMPNRFDVYLHDTPLKTCSTAITAASAMAASGCRTRANWPPC